MLYNNKQVIEMLKKQAKTVKERQCYPAGTQKMPPLRHTKENKLNACKAASL